jgi:hypothetical protein
MDYAAVASLPIFQQALEEDEEEENRKIKR